MSKIRKELLVGEKNSYASGESNLPQDMMDCTEGINPYGCPEEVLTAMGFRSVEEIINYPHDQSVYDAICTYWKAWARINKNNILLTDGSIAGIFVVNNIFARKGAKVLGIAPQFSDYISNARFLGMEYQYVKLERDRNYGFNLDELLHQITEDLSLIYIDNPNNPTGQTISCDDIVKILQVAKEKGVYVILDEAYGDFVARKESAMRFINDYENLIILRTLSKGFGMAGLRAAYIVTSEKLIHYMNKLVNPYAIGETSRKLISIALQNAYRLERDTEEFASAKMKVRAVLGNKIKMAETDDRVPIFMLYHEDPTVNMHKLMAENGLLTVNGDVFETIDHNCVRVRLSSEADFPKYMELLKNVVKLV